MSSLVDFLLARIAEDQEVARAAAPGPWTYGNIESVAGGSLYDPGVMIASIHWDNPGDRPDPRIHRFRSEEQADRTGDHIARHDPARVLAECEAKRELVGLHKEVLIERPDDDVGIPYDALCEVDNDDFPCATLRLLALPHADHPDYREEWRP